MLNCVGNILTQFFIMKKVTISVCVKNEQATIINCLNSIIRSISDIKDPYLFKIIICFNGTVDNSRILVEKWKTKVGDIKIIIIDLPEGNLVSAQRACMQSKENDGDYFAFFDADIILDSQCLSELLCELSNPKVVVTYAISHPEYRKDESLIERTMNLYDKGPSIYSDRKHLHGRTFITKDWNIPEVDPPLMVDDIYLSFYFLNKYGASSIKRVASAIVYFHQIRSWSDYYRVYRRRNIELHKCLALFPEFSDTPKDQINRQIIWKKFWEAPINNKFLWLMLFIYKRIASLKYNYDKFVNPVNREQWETPITSKRARTDPYLILIEGLDCSGKKTLARIMYSRFIDKGISSEIINGPLGPKWYRRISQIVSLNNFPNFIRSFVYSIEILLASRKAAGSSADIVIQTSSVLRSSAYANIKNIRFRWYLYKLFSYRVPLYDKVLYLTVSYEERKKRHTHQIAAGENSDLSTRRFIGESFFNKLENVLEELLEKHFNEVCRINTEKKSPTEIADSVLKDIHV